MSLRAGSSEDSAVTESSWLVAAVCIALAVFSFSVFGQTVRFDFVGFDDNDYVFDNPMVRGGLTFKGVVWAFTHSYSSNWHPLTWISHMLDCQIYGLRAGGHHLSNVLLHTATVIVLFLALRWMTGTLWRSAFVAAVFAIHPLRVESVAWVSERKDVLSGLFFMLTIWAYARWARSARELKFYWFALFLFALGLMSKPMLVTLPLVLLLLDYWPLRRAEAPGKLIVEKLPFFGLSAASCAVTLWAQRQSMASMASISLPMRLGNALWSYLVYVKQMIYPARLAVFYPFPRMLLVWKLALAGVVLAAVSAAAWRWRRQRPWLLVGWLWYLLMLLPVIGIVQVGQQAHADRYTYLPQIGLYIASTWLAAEFAGKWQTVLNVVAVAVIAALMAIASKQATYWRDSETLALHSLACTADNDVVRVILGDGYVQEGRVDDEIEQFQRAVKLNPKSAVAHNNLGNALSQKGKLDEAIVEYQAAEKADPHFAQAQFNLGNALRKKGKLDEAIVEYQKVLEINAGYTPARMNLGDAYLEKGKSDEAITCFKQVLAAEPNNEAVRAGLEKALLQKR